MAGGYQKPNNPAPASGPGALSRRTDGGPADPKQPIRELPNADYGEAKQFRQQQQAAPLSATPGPSVPKAQTGAGAPLPRVPFDAPTQYPDEPVTAGAALGPGPGPEALRGPYGPSRPQPNQIVGLLERIAGNDPTGGVARLLEQAMREQA